MMAALRSAVVLALVALLGGLLWLARDQGAKTAELEAERDQLQRIVIQREAELEQAREARRVHEIYLQQAEEEAARLAEITRELQSMEGRDAPLSPLLGAAAERLFSE